MRKTLFMSALVIAAIVLGALLGDVCASSQLLYWLAYSKYFSFQTGTLDIVILSFNFGFSFNVNIAQLILIFAAVFIFYKTAPKLITTKKS